MCTPPGRRRKRGPAAQALGRSRGGFSTKIHLAADSDAIRARLAARGIEALIPSLACRKEPITHDPIKVRERNRVERPIGKLKQFRGIATRYDKLAGTFLAFIHLAAALIVIR